MGCYLLSYVLLLSGHASGRSEWALLIPIVPQPSVALLGGESIAFGGGRYIGLVTTVKLPKKLPVWLWFGNDMGLPIVMNECWAVHSHRFLLADLGKVLLLNAVSEIHMVKYMAPLLKVPTRTANPHEDPLISSAKVAATLYNLVAFSGGGSTQESNGIHIEVGLPAVPNKLADKKKYQSLLTMTCQSCLLSIAHSCC